MPDTESDVAKAQAWDWLLEQLYFLEQVDRKCSREVLAGWLHVSLERPVMQQSLEPPQLENMLEVADLLGGIAKIPDELKPMLRDNLKDSWIQKAATK